MSKWEAIVQIVQSFNARGSPRLAFAIVIVFLLIPAVFFGLIIAFAVPQDTLALLEKIKTY